MTSIGERNYQLSQASPRQRQALERARNPENGRFQRVSGDLKVADVASFQSHAPDLVKALGHLKVDDVRQLFGGRSVTQIRKMGAAARAAVLGTDFGAACKAPGARAARLGANLGFFATTGVQVGGNPPAVYDDPGIGAFVAEAREHLTQGDAALHGGEAQNTARHTEEAKALAQVILDDHPTNPDALLVRGEATQLQALASVDRRAPHNGSNNVRRQARADLKAALADFERVVDTAEKSGVYDRGSNTLTLPNVNKFVGNDQVRNLVSATADALYQIAKTKVALAEVEGTSPFSEANLAALDAATSLKTDLTDSGRAQQLVTESSWGGEGRYAQAHNAKVKATVNAVAEYAAGAGAENRARFENDPALKLASSAPAFRNAIGA